MGFGGGGAADPAPVQPSGPSTDNVMSPGRPSSGGGGGISLGSLADPNDYIAAHFDKKVNEESARQSLPVDSWRWQKRFFIFSGRCLWAHVHMCWLKGQGSLCKRVWQRVAEMLRSTDS
jgi:hypothetical protein